MEGEGEPCQPAPSPWIPAHTTQLQGDLRTPLTHNNTQQHIRTPNNRQQHTTTVHNSTRDNLRGQKSLGPLKMSLEMAHKVIVPPKNYVPQFLKQRDINSYKHMTFGVICQSFNNAIFCSTFHCYLLYADFRLVKAPLHVTRGMYVHNVQRHLPLIFPSQNGHLQYIMIMVIIT